MSAVPSLCSLLKAFHKVYYDPSTHDDAALGRAVRDLSAELLHKVPRDIKESGLPCADVVYNTFVADPVATVRGIYQQLGWDFTAEYEGILHKHIAEDRLKRQSMKSKRGAGAEDVLHTYAPEEFHLTAQELTEGKKFADYVKQYNIPMSTN